MIDDEILGHARTLVTANTNAVTAAASALTPGFCRAARVVAACRGKVLVVGCGTSGNIAERAAHIFSVSGTPAFSIAPDDGLHGGLGVLQADDALIAISNGGNSVELNEFCRRGKALASCPVIAITAAPQSPLAQLADCVICIDMSPDADFGGILATGSTVAAATITDALAVISHKLRGYPWERVLYSHPSGAVGLNAGQSAHHLAGEEST